MNSRPRLPIGIFLLFFANFLIAQTQLLTTFTLANGSVNEIKQVNNSLLLPGNSFFKTLDLATNNLQHLDGQGKLRMAYNSSGMFSVEFSNGSYYLKFQGPGTDFTSAPVAVASNSNYPVGGIICNDKYYVMVPSNNIYNLWESDGTSPGTKIIYTGANELPSVTNIGDTLIFSKYNGANYDLCSYKPNGQIQVFKTIGGVPSFASRKNDDDYYYMTRSDSNGTWKGNIQNTTALFTYSVNNVVLKNGNYYTFGTYSSLYNWGATNTIYHCLPNVCQEFRFVKRDSTKTLESNFAVNENFVISESTDYGYEIAYADPATDSLRLEDLAKGARNGVYTNNNPGSGGHFFLACIYNNELYYVGTNGNDNYYYLYKTNGTTQTSLFKIALNYGITALYINNGYVYWADKDLSQTVARIFKRKLTDLDPQQPSSKTNSEEWSKFFKFYDYSGNTHPLPLSYESQADKNGNIISSFLFNSQNQYIFFCTNDSNFQNRQACNVFTKTDKWGNLEWSVSLGQLNANYTSSSRFCIDKHGNVLVAGSFGGSAVFGQDTIKQSSTGACNPFYIAKLSASNGNVMWKKIISCTPSYNDLQLDKMICDNDDNVYLSFLYNGNATILNTNLTYTLEPVNGLMKLRDTNLVWIKNIPTPWTNYYGRTYNLLFDSLSSTLLCTQTQSYYNMSSGCNFSNYSNFIQRIDTSGNILFTKEILTSDISNLPAVSIINNSILYTGYARGNLSIDGHSYATPYDPSVSCNKTETFSYLTDLKTHNFKTLRILNDPLFLPFNSVTDGNYIYVLGTEETNNTSVLVIKRFNPEGKLISKRVFKHIVQEQIFFLPNYNIMIDGDHLIVSGFSRETFDTLVNPFLTSVYSFFDYVVWRFNKNEGWQDDGNDKIIYLIKTDNDLVMYPNPTDSKIYFQIKNPGTVTSVEIYDILGRLILQTIPSREINQFIDISILPKGSYTLKLLGDNTYIKKIIKL